MPLSKTVIGSVVVVVAGVAAEVLLGDGLGVSVVDVGVVVPLHLWKCGDVVVVYSAGTHICCG